MYRTLLSGFVAPGVVGKQYVYTLFSVSGCWRWRLCQWWGQCGNLTDDDFPDFVIRLSTNDALSGNAVAQKVDTSEPLPSLNRVMPNAPLERLKNFPLSSIAHGIVLVGFGRCAEMEIEANENVLDGDDGVPRVGPNGAVPRDTCDANG